MNDPRQQLILDFALTFLKANVADLEGDGFFEDEGPFQGKVPTEDEIDELRKQFGFDV